MTWDTAVSGRCLDQVACQSFPGGACRLPFLGKTASGVEKGVGRRFPPPADVRPVRNDGNDSRAFFRERQAVRIVPCVIVMAGMCLSLTRCSFFNRRPGTLDRSADA